MILTCPQCTTRYQADEAKFPSAGRAVRCAKCSHTWHQPGPTTEPQAVPAEVPMSMAAGPVESIPSVAAPAPARPRVRTVVAEEPKARWLAHFAIVAGWFALAAIVLLIAFSVVRYRRDIATLWPQSASLYSTLGLNVDRRGIDFVHVAYSREIEDGQSVLAVAGTITNNADRELPVPQMIRVTLSDASNRELYRWTFSPSVQTLGPGQSVPFRTRLSSPPSGARHLEIRFDGS